MANMSYCRFENTSGDLRDCIGAINDAIETGTSMADFVKGLSSEYERSAFHRMCVLVQQFQEAVEELEAVEEGVLFDNEMDA